MKDGIYFGLPMDDYLAIERLSKSHIKNLLVSPADFWAESWLNPEPETLTPEQEKRREKARLLGKAYHTARLEPDQFDRLYARELSKDDMPEGSVFTGADMKAALKELGEKQTGSIREQAARLEMAGFDRSKIWLFVQEDYAETLPEGCVQLSPEDYDDIKRDMERMRSVQEIDEALRDGFPEVSILYTCPDTGLPMKCRIDWLRADAFVEFKTFSNPNGKPLDRCIIDAIKWSRYYIDVIVAHGAVEAIRTQGLQPIGECEEAARDMIAAIQLSPDPLPHRLIFQQKGNVPNVQSRSLQLFEVPIASQMAALGAPTEADVEHGDRETRRPTMLMQKGSVQIKRAKQTFERYSEIYERGDPWLPWNPHSQVTDLEFGQFWLEEI